MTTKTPLGRSASLSLMMLLQYAVWGLWLPILSIYLERPPVLNDAGDRIGGGLGFSGAQIGLIFGFAASIGALAAPFLAGQIADRFINAEKWLGILLIVGGLLKAATAYAETFDTFLILSIAYSVAYMPTLALTNSIAFANLHNRGREFPLVRTWGTIGWIIASSLFPLLWLAQIQGLGWIPDAQNEVVMVEGEARKLTWIPPFFQIIDHPDSTARIADAFRVSGLLSILYGIWAMIALPKTPPNREAAHPLAFLRAFGEFKRPGLLVITLAALPISIIHQVYFMRTAPFLTSLGFAEAQAGPIMSIGQISEIVFLGVLALVLKRLGFKLVLVLGCAAYFVRFALFAIASDQTAWIAPTANVLHGLCYGFFFAGAFLYVDRVTTPDVRHSAQTVFAIIILGIGPILAGFYNGWLGALGAPAEEGGPFDYAPLWWLQAVVGLVCAVFVLAAFRLDPENADAGVADAESSPSS